MKHQSQHQHQLTPQVCAALFPHLPELELQRDQLTREIDQVRAHGLSGGSLNASSMIQGQPQMTIENEPGNGKNIHSVQAKSKSRRKISAAHKERLSIAAKARWAKRKAA